MKMKAISTQVSIAPKVSSVPAVKPRGDKRRRERLKLSLAAHVRPFDPRFREIEDVVVVDNFTREGLYFTTLMMHYVVGMRLEITFPYGENVVAHRKYLGAIVRLEDRGNGESGVSVRFVF
jgi:hypothetical protein